MPSFICFTDKLASYLFARNPFMKAMQVLNQLKGFIWFNTLFILYPTCEKESNITKIIKNYENNKTEFK